MAAPCERRWPHICGRPRAAIVERKTARRSRLITDNALVLCAAQVGHSLSAREPRRSIRRGLRPTQQRCTCAHDACFVRTAIARNIHGAQTRLGEMANGARTATCHWFSMHATVPTLPHANRCSSSSAARHHSMATTGGPTLPILKAVRGVIFSSSSAASDDVLVSDSALTLPARSPRVQCAGQERASQSHAQGLDGRAEARVGHARDSTVHSSRSLREWG